MLLAGVSGAAIACLPGAASAATYFVSTDSELRAAITAANGDGDSSSTIVMTASFATASTSLPVPTKSITIDTQGFTLSGPANSGIVITGTGAVRTLVGTFMGTDGGSSGAGLQIRNGASVTNMGLVEGGTNSIGNGGAGVDFGGAATALVNHGTVRGGPSASGTGGIGVLVRSGAGQIVNTGTIEGGGAGGGAIVANGATVSIDVVNSGTIRAGAGANAIGWSSGITPTTGVIQLELQDGSQIFGNVVANAAATTDRLRLSGTGFSILDGSIGTAGQYQNFDIFEKTGSGTWTLTANNTATTNWDIQQGTLQLGNGGTTGSIIGDVTNSGTLAFDRSNTYSYAGVISGSGAVTQIGTGTTVLAGDNSYSGGTTISAGTLQLGNGGATGSIVGNVVNNGTLAFKRSDTLAYSGIISGTGAVRQLGSGTTVLTGANTYSGGTTISNGVLSVSADNNLGDASGGLAFNGGTLQTTSAFTSGRNVTLTGNGTFQTDADLGLTGAISGSGLFTKTGAGTLTLSGNNSYTGGTRILGGTLEAEGGNAIGDQSAVVAQAGVFRVLDNETIGMLSGDAGTVELVGNLTTSTNFANTTALFYGGITGTGDFVKNGAYRQVLAGNSSYQGATQILAGTLFALGTGIDSIPDSSAVTVAAGATLSLVRPPLSPIFTGIDSDDETIGSLSGAGNVNLGDRKLTIGGDASTIFSGVISGAGGSLAKLGNGTLTLSGTSTYTGATTIEAGKLSVKGSIANSAVTILNGGALGGNGTVGATTLQAGGVIAPGNSIGTLTIDGNYAGAGGTLEIEAMLDGDASSADRLVITGDTSGATYVKVIGVGGSGAQTSEGIKIVDVGGISAGTFSLLGNYVFEGDQAVVAGAYAYRLYKNGISTPSDGDWYLRSSLISPDDPTPPVDPTPLYSPAAPIYEAYAGVLQSFTQLGTLQQRVGNRSWGGTQSGAGDGVEQGSPIWGRIEASHSEFDPGTTTTGTDYDADLWKLQAGLDTLLSETEAGVLIGGVTVHYGTVKSDISSFFGTGSIDTTGYGLGGTLTWYGKNGFYVDTQAELTWFDSDLSSATLGKKLADGNNGFGYGLGIEAGQKIALQGNWSLTPQAQLSYSSVDFDSFTDPYGALVSNVSSDSLIGRLGLSADYESEWKGKADRSSRSHVYGVANLYYDVLDGYDVDVSGAKLVSKAQPLWGGLGVGGSLSWADDRYSVHGELLARTSLEDFGESHAFGGTVGFKVKW
ncbi:autotransporter outer membrane beta-barrel domain-containing protein [Mesorhizobium sp. M1B.F.Ca.ET.045.04.1.1]|uniref:autotransporter outer membrane beta-barrel domain-containing protein n=1 Tax=Mesorhizobium sp. M1B.F.Ca.ET.045.04.1.1 TaxID=2493673 RepID=UPI000F759AFE|nr:autotransporter outer membrane beta-barrel domain-containing protein [Mesorhizobium sp. M1B.F.Ca.ET.045.04.1.1]AZO28843.1 autotransporter outer membrane beta-barrel domain-containing protein [Mesorhizobium sp. M1B.F.Ca.ET.045.04.1.1]